MKSAERGGKKWPFITYLIFIQEEERKIDQLQKLARYIKVYKGDHLRIYLHSLLNTVLYIVNLICQGLVLDEVFGGHFLLYGVDFNRDLAFPKVTTCAFLRNGFSKQPEIRYHTCYLPTNLFHQWFFLVLWYLGCVSGILLTCELIYCVISFFCPPLRMYMLKVKADKKITQEQIAGLLSDLKTLSHNSETYFLQVLFQNLSDNTISELFDHIWISLYLVFMHLMIMQDMFLW